MTTTSIDRRSGAYLQAAIKLPCRAVAVADITLDGLQTIDGVALAAADRVLVTGQTDTTENGIYVADTGEWARSADCNGSRDLVQGTIVAVVAGTLYTGSVWQVTTASPVVGSALAWERMGASALALVSAFMLTVLDDVDAATARATLDVPSKTEAILDTLLTTQGDIIIASAANTPARLARGTASQFLGVTGNLPAWKTLVVAKQTFTASGTYTPGTGMVHCIIRSRGGGGGGGGAATAGAGTVRCGGGGGQGELAHKAATAADIGASQVITIGAGGAGGTGNAVGSNGGVTSVGVLCVANGGTGGESGNASSNAGGAGGTGGTGDHLEPGAPGGTNMLASINTVSSISGAGGGAGGGRPRMSSSGNTEAGAAGAKGGGGSGALTFNVASGTNVTGGAGGGGWVEIIEFLLQ